MLISLGRYSNWWGDMTENLYYLRSADYMAILNREKVGLFQVPMVHSTFLVDLRRSESRYLSYGIDVEAYKVCEGWGLEMGLGRADICRTGLTSRRTRCV